MAITPGRESKTGQRQAGGDTADVALKLVAKSEQCSAVVVALISAYVTEAVRRRIQSDTAREALRAAGHREFPFDPVASAGRLAGAVVPADAHRAALDRLAAAVGGDRDDLAARLGRSAEAAGW